MKRLVLGIFTAVVICAVPAIGSAQQKITIGADAAFVLPISKWSDFSGIGFGALGKGYYGIAENIDLTGRVGFIVHLGKDIGGASLKTTELPILFGGRYSFGAEGLKPYAQGEIGLTLLTVSNPVASDSELKASLALGGGVMIGAIDLHGQIFWPSVGDFGDIIGIMITAGYNFVSL